MLRSVAADQTQGLICARLTGRRGMPPSPLPLRRGRPARPQDALAPCRPVSRVASSAGRPDPAVSELTSWGVDDHWSALPTDRPAVHSEYLLLADVHIASERARTGTPPRPMFGITGGNGAHVVCEEMVGTAAPNCFSEPPRYRRAYGPAVGCRRRVVAGGQGLQQGTHVVRRLAASRRSTARCRSRRSISIFAVEPPGMSPSEWPSRASSQPTWPTRSRRSSTDAAFPVQRQLRSNR
jgi:hypothetical protein